MSKTSKKAKGKEGVYEKRLSSNGEEDEKKIDIFHKTNYTTGLSRYATQLLDKRERKIKRQQTIINHQAQQIVKINDEINFIKSKHKNWFRENSLFKKKW